MLLLLGMGGFHPAVLAQDDPQEATDTPAAATEQTTADSLDAADSLGTVVPPAAVDPLDTVDPLDEIRGYLSVAKKNGAKRHLPSAYRQLDDMIKQAEIEGVDDATLADLRIAGRRLVNQAEFLVEIRKQQSPLEALLGRYDQSLREIAALMGTTLDPELTGTPSADDLYAKLRTERLQRQVLIDSLTVANRHLRGTTGADAAQRDSTLVALQVEISDLRHQLWETQLRVGVAEADRSAVESELDIRKHFLDTVLQLEVDVGPTRGEILMTPGGGILARIFGFDFASGSAELKSGSQDLIDALAQAIRRCDGAEVRVDGHTDDTGTRNANLRLSRRRAETVANALAEKLQVDVAVITSVGHGPDLPIATNNSADGRARNRRIEVTIVRSR
jgi:outer membrane protein OmpA-like peptidoglycan-associated protein